jgi:hypothetical protein
MLQGERTLEQKEHAMSDNLRQDRAIRAALLQGYGVWP